MEKQQAPQPPEPAQEERELPVTPARGFELCMARLALRTAPETFQLEPVYSD